MAGHSKWKKIKHDKAKEDAKRGKLFTNLIKEITVAARTGGGDPTGNPRLRLLLDKSKEINMPLDNAMRAIKRGTGELPGQTYERYMYEGYGPGQIAVLTEVLTDNKNRAIAELRALFTRKGATIAESGAVSWMFSKLGVITVPAKGLSDDLLLEKLLDFDVKDIKQVDEFFNITCDPKSLDDIKQALKNSGVSIESAEIEWVAQNTMDLAAAEQEKAVEFLDALEDLDDVQHVYTNLA